MKSKLQKKQNIRKKIKFSKATLKKLSRIHKKYDEIFNDDKILLQELRSEINAQHRKAR